MSTNQQSNKIIYKLSISKTTPNPPHSTSSKRPSISLSKTTTTSPPETHLNYQLWPLNHHRYQPQRPPEPLMLPPNAPSRTTNNNKKKATKTPKMPSIKPPHEKPKFGHTTQQTPPAKPLMLQPKCEYQKTLKHHSNHAISIPKTPVNNLRNKPPINIYQSPLLKLIIAVCSITTTSTTAVNKERK